MKLLGLNLIIVFIFVEITFASIQKSTDQLLQIENVEKSPVAVNPEVSTRFGAINKRCGHSRQDLCKCFQPYPFVSGYPLPSAYGTAWGNQCGNQHYDDDDDISSTEKININIIKNTNVDNGGLQISNQNFADLFNPNGVNNPIYRTFDKIGGKLAQDIAKQLLNQQNLLYSAPFSNDNTADSTKQSSAAEDQNDVLDAYAAKPSIEQALTDLFHPENPQNPIVRAFEQTATKFNAKIEDVLGWQTNNGKNNEDNDDNDDDENNNSNDNDDNDEDNNDDNDNNDNNSDNNNNNDDNNDNDNDDSNNNDNNHDTIDNDDADKINDDDVNDEDNKNINDDGAANSPHIVDNEEAAHNQDDLEDTDVQENINDNPADRSDPEDLSYKKSYTLDELFHPDNAYNPIVRTFESIEPIFVNTILSKLSVIQPVDRNARLSNIAYLLNPENPENPVLRTFENLASNIAQAYSYNQGANLNDITKDDALEAVSNSKMDDQNTPKLSNFNDVPLSDKKDQFNVHTSDANPSVIEDQNVLSYGKQPSSDPNLYQSDINHKSQSDSANEDPIGRYSYNPIVHQLLYNPASASLGASYPFLQNIPAEQIVPNQNVVSSNFGFRPHIPSTKRQTNVVCLPVRKQPTVQVQHPFLTNIISNLRYNNYDNSQVRIVNPWTNL